MSGLETSVRTLVREEASSAAAETVAGIRLEVSETMAAIRGDLRSIAADEFKLSAERLTTWSRLNVVNPKGQSDRPAITRSEAELFEWRKMAIELAFANTADKGDTQSVLTEAARIARFLIDGSLDGEPRLCPTPVASGEGETA